MTIRNFGQSSINKIVIEAESVDEWVVKGWSPESGFGTYGYMNIAWKEFDIQEVLNNARNYIQRLKDGSIAVLKIVISGNGKQRADSEIYANITCKSCICLILLKQNKAHSVVALQ